MLGYLILLPALYTATSVGLTLMGEFVCQITDCYPFQKMITSHEELDYIVEEESAKLGLDHENITTIFNGPVNGALKRENGYELSIKTGLEATRNTVRHELYHIYKGHCDDAARFRERFGKVASFPINFSDYVFRREVEATLYGTFGIRI